MLNKKLNTFKAATLFISIAFLSCKTTAQEPVKAVETQKIEISKNAKWSDKMALTLMKRHPESYMIDNAKAPKWDYVHALVLHAFEDLYKKNPDPRYAAYVKNYVDILVQEDGSIKTYELEKYNIDLVLPGRLLFNRYKETKDNRYLVAMQTLKKQLEGQPRTTSGGFWHKQIYTNQMWLDGLYMGEPFYAQYTATFENGKKFATPLLVVVAVIEFTDLLFAVDSIPAIFAISSDPFILYTSNIFAILGLRALFFLLDNFIHLFNKLPYGLAVILSFIGVKMIIAPFYHIESLVSLMVIGGVLLISVILSVMFPDKKDEASAE